ncbi:MAG: hypothetical protein U0531_19060 [Dehalococcoidia bacterium]
MGLTSARQVAELLASAALGGAEVSAQVRWLATGLYGRLPCLAVAGAAELRGAGDAGGHALFLYFILALGWYRPWYVLAGRLRRACARRVVCRPPRPYLQQLLV